VPTRCERDRERRLAEIALAHPNVRRRLVSAVFHDEQTLVWGDRDPVRAIDERKNFAELSVRHGRLRWRGRLGLCSCRLRHDEVRLGLGLRLERLPAKVAHRREHEQRSDQAEQLGALTRTRENAGQWQVEIFELGRGDCVGRWLGGSAWCPRSERFSCRRPEAGHRARVLRVQLRRNFRARDGLAIVRVVRVVDDRPRGLGRLRRDEGRRCGRRFGSFGFNIRVRVPLRLRLGLAVGGLDGAWRWRLEPALGFGRLGSARLDLVELCGCGRRAAARLGCDLFRRGGLRRCDAVARLRGRPSPTTRLLW
jgi:hypothetical protein